MPSDQVMVERAKKEGPIPMGTRIVREEDGPWAVVRMATPGGIRDRKIPLEVWTDPGAEILDFEPPEDEEPKPMMSFVGHIARDVFRRGPEAVAGALQRQFMEIIVQVQDEAKRVGWLPSRNGGNGG